jgi:hypothetical protein
MIGMMNGMYFPVTMATNKPLACTFTAEMAIRALLKDCEWVNFDEIVVAGFKWNELSVTISTTSPALAKRLMEYFWTLDLEHYDDTNTRKVWKPKAYRVVGDNCSFTVLLHTKPAIIAFLRSIGISYTPAKVTYNPDEMKMKLTFSSDAERMDAESRLRQCGLCLDNSNAMPMPEMAMIRSCNIVPQDQSEDGMSDEMRSVDDTPVLESSSTRAMNSVPRIEFAQRSPLLEENDIWKLTDSDRLLFSSESISSCP